MGIDAPLLLRVDGELIAIDAEGTILVDFEGRRQLIHAPYAAIDSRGAGPYRLETSDRRILALTT
jgi:hypothetical protein